jgi:hypothetical protein
LTFGIPGFGLQSVFFDLRKRSTGFRNIVFSDFGSPASEFKTPDSEFGSPELRSGSIKREEKKSGKDVRNILNGVRNTKTDVRKVFALQPILIPLEHD